MKIAIFGLGYVGSVTAACLADMGHEVVGVDVNRAKVDRIEKGDSPVFEPGLEDLIADVVRRDRLHATDDPRLAVSKSDVIMITVGTPSERNGRLDMSYVLRVAEEIGSLLDVAGRHPVVCVRSTMLPGSHSEVVAVLERESSMRAGADFGFCVNPEFLREGSALRDFNQPPMTLIGELDPESGAYLASLYESLPGPLFRVELGVAEMVKYAGNAFHALKVAFANEIGVFSQALGIDGRQVMDVFVKDEKLNISGKYLRPGFAYGGSCLGKDLRAMLHYARQSDVDLPILAAVPSSNQAHINRAIRAVLEPGVREVALIGLSFKPGTDDLRESPLVALAEQLVGKGRNIRIFDREVNLATLHGTNKQYIQKTLPHLATLLQPSLETTLEGTGVVVLGKPLNREDQKTLLRLIASNQLLVDLVGLDDEVRTGLRGSYSGIAW